MNHKQSNSALSHFLRTHAALPPHCVDLLLDSFEAIVMGPTSLVAAQGEQNDYEYLLVSGAVAHSICDTNGKSICVGLYQGPISLAPHMSRTRKGASLVNIEVLETSLVAQVDAAQFLKLMVENTSIREWGNAIMRNELQLRTDHQWALAALNNRAKLAWFRDHLLGFEAKFEHWRIASYLGMTPVSFSRVRRELKTAGSATKI